MAIYHVTREWDGEDLRSVARMIDDSDVGLDEGLRMLAAKWFGGDIRAAESYLDTDGHEVHCHATLDEAIAYRDEWCQGGVVLKINDSSLDVMQGTEYPHPVVRDAIPAWVITVVA